jgi:hypothetical protein
MNTGLLGVTTMSTTAEKAPKKASTKSDSEQAKRLLDEALKQPGVREFAEVYGQVRRYEEAAGAYRAVLCPEPTEWASSSSAPLAR